MNFRYANSVFDRPLSAASATNIVEFPNAPNRMLLSDPVSKWREAAGKRLNELIRLECGWDGCRGAPVSFEIAYFTIQLLEAACGPHAPIPQIVPGAAGDLQIEWHTQIGDIELDVRAPNDVSAWRRTASTDPEREQIALTNHFSAVANWIKELTEPSCAPGTAAA
jgi:hypothetical protein